MIINLKSILLQFNNRLYVVKIIYILDSEYNEETVSYTKIFYYDFPLDVTLFVTWLQTLFLLRKCFNFLCSLLIESDFSSGGNLLVSVFDMINSSSSRPIWFFLGIHYFSE